MNRINKELSRRGLCSRREADRLIANQRVLINGLTARMGQKVTSQDHIEVEGIELHQRAELRVFAFYKPRGVICTFSSKETPNLSAYVSDVRALKYAGRLDKESEGLMILTSDGNLIHELTHPSFGHSKEYKVHVHRRVTLGEVERLTKGLTLEDGLARVLKAEQTQQGILLLELVEGRNRQIRRMCKALGLKVQRLIRTRIGQLHMKLKPGQLWELNPSQIQLLKRNVS